MKKPYSPLLGILALGPLLTSMLFTHECVAAAATDSAEAVSTPLRSRALRPLTNVPSPHILDRSNASEASAEAEASLRSMPVYVPPRRGQPRARVGGGVRGPRTRLPTLQALVPDHVALTARAQPTLLWHLDPLPPDRTSLMFSLTNEDEIDPIVAVVLERPVRPGLQRIDLSGYAIELEAGKEYQWSVALVMDIEHRSRDLITFGWIERVKGPHLLETHRATSPRPDRATFSRTAALAAAGLWYDAVDAANGIERTALLQQVGLPFAEQSRDSERLERVDEVPK